MPSEETKERIIRAVEYGHTVLHYGWIPFIIYVGYTRSNPQPSLINSTMTIMSSMAKTPGTSISNQLRISCTDLATIRDTGSCLPNDAPNILLTNEPPANTPATPSRLQSQRLLLVPHLPRTSLAMLVSSFALAYLSSFVFATPVISGALHVHERRGAPPVGYTMMGRPSDDHVLSLGLALVENNRDGLVQKLYAVSTPDSPDYGNHLSKEDVEALVAPSPNSVAAVKAWLSAHNLSARSITPAGDWLSLNMTVKQANRLLAADYCAFADETGRQAIRTLSYSIPPSLKKHLDFVHPTIGFPVPVVGDPTTMKHYSDTDLASQDVITTDSVPASCAKMFTPACAEALYGIPKRNATQTNNRLAVSGFLDQYASKADLKTFLKRYRPDLPSSTTFTVKLIDDGKNFQSHPGMEAVSPNLDVHLEGTSNPFVADPQNLDTQYTVGIASHVPTVFISVGDDNHDGVEGFLDIIHVLLKDKHLPQVLTTSYGVNEPDIPPPLAQKLCHAYAQLGARGTSVIFSSGDGGVSGSQDSQCTTFVPTFPSTCPFVTSVGGTQGVNPETAADLSAGGFSTIFSIPPYQSAAVASYLAKLKKTNKGRFNRTGRAYPDVSAAATNVSIVVKGKFGGVDGTSCAAPITASIFSLLNDQLIAARKKPLGFLNPLIYAKADAFKDIVSGSNPGCNTTGFPATKGWDPVTGVGRPIFHALKTTVGL
ncbi:hypothetical protein EVG20_g4594 [Dentipellis fragilis]|uniref:tripeptidyl-peptidase II n=1 Tax=Dentipellis fragilis TaxID=205917 RepID=A0A4Y9YXZ6_9AGAM|nr:hypothetical protein EVG20_g4594 [Dentipellis fragilis]